jgi:tRNA (guanine-N7-)-methyltransferase
VAIETEFGVPIAGEILPAEAWTQTALKSYPAEGPLDWPTVFGRIAPIVLDLGCGNGRFAIGSSVTRPDFDHVGVDRLPVVIRYARRRGNQRGLTNLKFAVGDGYDLVARRVVPHSVAEVHLYHPQPYYDARLVHKRQVTPELIAAVHQALEAGGTFVIQTDNPGYWRYIRAIVPTFFDFQEMTEPWADQPRGRTRREIIARSQGLTIFRGIGIARAGISAAEALALATSLPPPVFDANRRLREVDRLEAMSRQE